MDHRAICFRDESAGKAQGHLRGELYEEKECDVGHVNLLDKKASRGGVR